MYSKGNIQTEKISLIPDSATKCYLILCFIQRRNTFDMLGFTRCNLDVSDGYIAISSTVAVFHCYRPNSIVLTRCRLTCFNSVSFTVNQIDRPCWDGSGNQWFCIRTLGLRTLNCSGIFLLFGGCTWLCCRHRGGFLTREHPKNSESSAMDISVYLVLN